MKWYYAQRDGADSEGHYGDILDTDGKLIMTLPGGLTPYWEIVIRAVNNYDDRSGKIY